MADPRIRQIKIKTGVVKSITKEISAYVKEVETQKAKIENMANENKDEHDIKKQNEVLGESHLMIPDTKRRLQNFVDELASMLAREADLAESKEYTEAEEVLEAARAFLN